MIDSDVIVVGGGPVGLLNALGLAQAGLTVIVLEREAAVPASPRAAVYFFFALDGLERFGVLEDVERAGIVDDGGLHVHDFRTRDVFSWPMDVLRGHTAHPYNINL